MFIDADTHVDECAETWEYLAKNERHVAPTTITFERDEIPPWVGPIGPVRSTMGTGYESGYYRLWFIDGQVFVRRVRNDERTGTMAETRELRDIPGRLAAMDAMGVATQVLYPTLFLNEVTRRPELEAALYRAYNRWIADRCAGSGGRLRWVAMIPFGSPGDAVEEIGWAKAHGAVGLYKRGVEGVDRGASDPYFYSAYHAAEEADLPICIHQASSWSAVQASLTIVRRPAEFPLLAAFTALVSDRVRDEFPRLRFGFIEAGSSWVPYLLDTTGSNERGVGLDDLGFFVTCEVAEDIGYLIGRLGPSSLVVGTDYGHADRASIRDAHRRIAARPDVDPAVAEALTADNARRLYGL